ncbi:Hypothetical predicted protein [Mytilus galloprovincialis]|uniref:PHD-type domain-containing protein n=1 Tax=Mytilus galloprovincialis TaxID=29158 RepID=A0A8B6E115_MYTGA|nr:Hypothetical predicted protein [Mytilus galloprovincialis]
MGTDHCVECSRVVTTRQQALTCDNCERWVHRVCNTGITQTDYRRLMKGKLDIAFTCNLCKNTTENAPVESTRLEQDSEQRSTLTGYGTFNISLISRKSNSVNSTFTEVPSGTSNPTNLPYAPPVNTPHRNGLSRVPRRILPPLSPHRTFNVASLAPEQASIEQPTSNTVANSSTNDATPASPSYTPRRNGLPRVPRRILSPLSPNRTYNVVSVAPEQSVMQPPTYHTSRIVSPSLPDASQTHLNRTTSVHPLSPLPLDASFDFTHHQDENDDQEIVENSIQEPELPDTILPDGPPTFSIIEKGTQRSNLKLVSSDGYEYTKKMSKGDFTYWRCIKRSKGSNCPATVSQKGENFKRNPKPHIHPADKGALKKVLVHKEVKQTALQDIHKPAGRIVDDAMLRHIEPEDHQLPNQNNLKRTANRVREELRPDEPTSLFFELDTDYLQCDNFLIEDIRVDDQRHLVFSTPGQLQLLKYAKKWFCDGTFKIMKDPFTQLWSIHAFIKKGDSLKQVPLVFVLMSRKKTKDYKPILECLKRKIGVLHVEGFCLDFEKGAWKAIRHIFPNASIKGCAFHFGQAIWRKVQDLGLKTTYSSRGVEYRYIRTLMALPFLPHSDIRPAFNTLKERWHTRINSGKSNVSFYVLIPELMREAEIVDLTLRLVSEEQVLRHQRRRFKDLEGRLHQFWEEYDSGEKNCDTIVKGLQ